MPCGACARAPCLLPESKETVKHSLFVVMLALVLVAGLAPTTAAGEEIDALVRKLDVPARFEEHRPNFSVHERTFTFQGLKGPYEWGLWLIRDGRRCVAIYSKRPQIDLITHDPAKAPRKLDMPVRYHNSTWLGTRVTTIPWVDKGAVTGDEHGFHFSDGGETITLTEWQKWDGDNKYGRKGRSVHTFTLRCDRVLGYVVDIDCKLEIDALPTKGGKAARGCEFTNMMAGGMVDMWPGRWKYDRTVFSRADLPEGRYFGWWNNPAAADLSDNNRSKMVVRPGGLVAFLPDRGWGPALSRQGDYTFRLATCNVWQDQHNHVDFPDEPDPDGVYRMNPRFRLCFLPPKVTAHVLERTKINDFGGRRAVLLRFGVQEGFEDQPMPLTTPLRGGYTTRFTGGRAVATDVSRSGRKSLRVDGTMPKAKAGTGYEGFFFTPQFNLDANTTYRIEAWVKVRGKDTEAWLQGDLYEWTPHDKARFRPQRTRRATAGGGWQHIELVFTTPALDPFVDLRFIAAGQGEAYFDDFRIQRIGTRPEAEAAEGESGPGDGAD